MITGTMEKTITPDRYPKAVGAISVKGNELAVPGWDDKKLYLYNIKA